MSEFCCRNGHFMSAGEMFCKECGGRLYTMDGMTASQIRQMEKEEQKFQEEPEEEDNIGE